MNDDFTTLQLDPLLVALGVATRQIERLIRTHGHHEAEVICRGLMTEKNLPREYRVSLQTAFGG